jgi:hypothetical protein
LSTLAAAVDTFDGDQFSAGGHVLARPELTGQPSKISLTADTLRCNAARARIRIRT